VVCLPLPCFLHFFKSILGGLELAPSGVCLSTCEQMT
jgi:hypothetical protein